MNRIALNQNIKMREEESAGVEAAAAFIKDPEGGCHGLGRGGNLGRDGGLHVRVKVGDEGGVDGRRAHALRRVAERAATHITAPQWPPKNSHRNRGAGGAPSEEADGAEDCRHCRSGPGWWWWWGGGVAG